MPGVIEKDSDGRLLYEIRPLENVSMKVKMIGVFLFSLHIILVISIIPIIWFAVATEDSKEPDTLAVIGLITCCFESLLVVMIPLLAYRDSCSTQIVYCAMPKQKVGSFSVCFLIICTLQVLASIFSEVCISLKIGVIVYSLSINLGAISSLYYWKSFCQCKTCLGLKEVKLIYKGERISITERNGITSMNLQKWFNLSLPYATRLAIQINNGEIIYEFTQQNLRVQLHAGEYIIREITINVNPVVSPFVQPEISLLLEETPGDQEREPEDCIILDIIVRVVLEFCILAYCQNDL